MRCRSDRNAFSVWSFSRDTPYRIGMFSHGIYWEWTSDYFFSKLNSALKSTRKVRLNPSRDKHEGKHRNRSVGIQKKKKVCGKKETKTNRPSLPSV